MTADREQSEKGAPKRQMPWWYMGHASVVYSMLVGSRRRAFSLTCWYGHCFQLCDSRMGHFATCASRLKIWLV